MSLYALVLVAVTAPATAQPAPSPSPAVAAQAPLDPDRLAAARVVMAALFPPGTYRRMMNGTMVQMMNGMTQQMLNVPLAQFVATAGLSKEDVANLGSTTTRQIMDIVDPAFERRTATMQGIMLQSITDLLVRFEPDLRESYAEAYARRLTTRQLDDLATFLRTPSGRAYAENGMVAYTDPAVLQKMQVLLPAIIQAMPAIMQKAQAATADLPKPRKIEELPEADRDRLGKLLGIDPAKLKTRTKEQTS